LTTTSRLQRSRDMIADFVTPHLEAGEGIKVVLANANGPLPPLTPIVPIFGVAAMCTRWFRAYALVVTDGRVLLVRRGKIRPGRPQSIDLALPIERVKVLDWTERPSYGTLALDADGQQLRLHTVGTFSVDVPAILEALRVPSPSTK
jgi:hypothetical protein